MLDPNSTLALAERVAEAAQQLGVETALIGATALAVHHYTRGTEDLDLAAVTDPAGTLPKLSRALEAMGLRTRLRLPDDDDPLGGVLRIWEHEDEDGEPIDPVELVNFLNPSRPTPNPARAAIQRATKIGDGPLRCVTLPDLVALKLYAGSRSDLADIVEVLAQNPDVDLTSLRSIAKPFDATDQLEDLITEAARMRGA